jgi:hypothetical protein
LLSIGTSFPGCAPATTSTSVTNAAVYPTNDVYGLIIHNPEVDTAQVFLQTLYNASGTVWVDNGEIFQAIYGAAVINSAAMSLRWTNTVCYGCGQPNFNNPDDITHAIHWKDSTQSKSADVVINNSAFYPLPGPLGPNTWGGNIYIAYAHGVDIHDSQLWDVDNWSNYKSSSSTLTPW